MSQQVLAERVGVSREYVSMIENGKREITRYDLLASFARGLGVDIGALIDARGGADLLTDLLAGRFAVPRTGPRTGVGLGTGASPGVAVAPGCAPPPPQDPATMTVIPVMASDLYAFVEYHDIGDNHTGNYTGSDDSPNGTGTNDGGDQDTGSTPGDIPGDGCEGGDGSSIVRVLVITNGSTRMNIVALPGAGNHGVVRLIVAVEEFLRGNPPGNPRGDSRGDVEGEP